jgi:CheY-like chemotaxis protein
MNMPVLDGYGAVAAMRAWEGEQRVLPTPMVALTGRAMLEDRERSIEAGCNAHLTKPIRCALLMETISRFTKVLPAEC